MFDAESLRAFLITYEDKLQAAVNAYYDDIAQAEGPKSGLARLLQGANVAITRMVAGQTIAETLRGIIREMHRRAALLANGDNPLDAGQYRAVQDAVNEQDNYLRGFLKDLPHMERGDALNRIVKYVFAGLQTASDVAAGHMPTLPHYPGDMDLACHGFCRCRLRVVRLGQNDWDVYWDLDPDGLEHCDDCVALWQAWSPLQIRDGEIVYATKAKREE